MIFLSRSLVGVKTPRAITSRWMRANQFSTYPVIRSVQRHGTLRRILHVLVPADDYFLPVQWASVYLLYARTGGRPRWRAKNRPLARCQMIAADRENETSGAHKLLRQENLYGHRTYPLATADQRRHRLQRTRESRSQIIEGYARTARYVGHSQLPRQVRRCSNLCEACQYPTVKRTE